MGEHEPEFDLLAGDLALDLVNTVGNRLDPARSRELLVSPAHFGRWLAAAGTPVVGLGEADLTVVHAVRERLHRLFQARAAGEPPDHEALAEIGRIWRASQGKQRLTIAANARVDLAWTADAGPLDRALLPVLEAAVDLLRSERGDFVRQCEGHGCGWLFLDRSRGRKRRWCSMQDCGNRAKAQRHYRRGRGDAGGGGG